LISGVGAAGTEPQATRVIDATDCLVTPGLVNTHHHMYQNLTRAFPPMTNAALFGWLQTLYPLWSTLDEEAANVSAWVGLAELALSGCTTSTDHLYVHPAGGGDLLTAEIMAAKDLGMRFHPTRGSMSLSQKDGGLPPDNVVQDHDVILAESQRAVEQHHDASHGAMVRIALAPCSPFSVTKQLMTESAQLAEKLDVRLHTHFAENSEDDAFSIATFGCRPTQYLEDVGWCTDRAWVAHCVMPNHDEIQQLGRAKIGVAHCPSSNMILSSGIAPVVDLRAAGVHVGLGVDGSSSADSASMWLEARQAMLLAKLRDGAAAGTARMSLEIATRGGAGCLGRIGEIGEISVGAVGDLAIWSLTGVAFAGAVADPIEAWLRCGPTGAKHTIVHGKLVVDNGQIVSNKVDSMLATHRTIAKRMQRIAHN
jgi:cytosine/adenosine deaminase-related metal-dependent hydrolase